MKLMKPLVPTPSVVRREMDTMLDRFFRAPLFPELLPGKSLEALWEPALDFSETEKEFIIRLEVPGFHKENLDVKFDADLLSISGHREARTEQKNEEYLWTEREEGRFTRTLRIPAAIDPAKIDANYENGLLTVRLLKIEPVPKTRITIR